MQRCTHVHTQAPEARAHAHVYTQHARTYVAHARGKTGGTSDRRCSDVRQFIYFRTREILLEYEIVTIPRYLQLSSLCFFFLFCFSFFFVFIPLSFSVLPKCILPRALMRLPAGISTCSSFSRLARDRWGNPAARSRSNCCISYYQQYNLQGGFTRYNLFCRSSHINCASRQRHLRARRPVAPFGERGTRRSRRATTILSWRIWRRRFESLLRCCYGMETRTGERARVDGRPTHVEPRRPRFRRPSLSLASLSLEHDTKTYTRGKVIFRRTAAAPSVDEFHCALRAPDDLNAENSALANRGIYIAGHGSKFSETIRVSVIQSP